MDEDRYSVSIAKRTPNATGGTAPTFEERGPVVASYGLSWSEELSREGEATVSTDPTTLDSNIVDDLVDVFLDDVPGLELWISKGTEIAFRGPIIGLQYQDPTLSFVARGPLYYCRYMIVPNDVTHSAVDQYEIGASLIDDWQDLPYGHFGLDTSGVGSSGTTRDRTYEDGDNVYERLTELGDVDGGFDIWVDPETRDVTFGSKGSDLSSQVVLDRRGISGTGLSVSMAAGDICSDAVAYNTDEENRLEASAGANSIRVSFGRSAVVGSFDGVTELSTLIGKATLLRDARLTPLVSPQPEIIPVSGAGVFDFSVGDTVQFVPRIGIPGISVTRRVLKKAVSVGDDGAETIGVEFA